MFDFGFTELLVIGVVALVVLGPERMPEVARTAGRLLAKAQGYISQVKNDFDKETQLSEVKKLREQFASQAASLRSSLTEVQSTLESETQAVNSALHQNATQEVQAKDPYTEFNQSEATLPKPAKRTSSFRTNNPFGWNLGESTEDSFQSQYVPKRYKPSASLDDVVSELEELRQQLALPRKAMSGYNRRYAPRARVNRPRIYR